MKKTLAIVAVIIVTMTGSGIKSSPVVSVANVGNLWRIETENTRYLWEVKG